ncbi:hypothetical protein FTUN_6994 [Frigoriglobus tundricola]|uniref:Uncharacterized protein n=1 Tax=Frigoriglobus tundricola TaxID=2774151 RepID=A0A6M5Z2H0_9BACT|nr:hypothetical protein FTUN_6994 [Frigoriglobus tundricola]
MEGRVTAADTGRAVAGVRVGAVVGSLTSQSQRITNVTSTADAAVGAPRVEFDTVSGPDGKFRLLLPPNGPYRVYVNAPEGSPCLSVDRWLAWEDGKAGHELSIALPVGRVVRGVMKDDAGQPVAGGWVMYQPACGNREVPRGVLTGRDAPARTGADGAFALAVPPGPGWLEGWGPAPDYRLAAYDPWPCPQCQKDASRTFEHARVRLEAGADPSGGKGVPLTLRRGESVRVEAIGTDGKPVTSGVAVCRSVVQPLRNRVTRPLLIREGSGELPGCVPDRVYPVALLDPVGLAGAVAEVRVGDKPVVKLEPCGAAEVRLVDSAGRPLAGVMAEAWLALDCDRAANARAGTQGRWLVDQSWFDPKHHLPRPVTDAAGRATLRALVPGAEYVVVLTVHKRVYTSAAVRVRPGETERLPDIVAVFAGSWETQPRQGAGPEDD